jgi:hypothetical protein
MEHIKPIFIYLKWNTEPSYEGRVYGEPCALILNAERRMMLTNLHFRDIKSTLTSENFYHLTAQLKSNASAITCYSWSSKIVEDSKKRGKRGFNRVHLKNKELLSQPRSDVQIFRNFYIQIETKGESAPTILDKPQSQGLVLPPRALQCVNSHSREI